MEKEFYDLLEEGVKAGENLPLEVKVFHVYETLCDRLAQLKKEKKQNEYKEVQKCLFYLAVCLMNKSMIQKLKEEDDINKMN